MKIPTHFKGTIYVHWHVECEFLHFTEYENPSSGFITIGSFDADVPLDDGRDAAVSAMREQIEQERAASRHRINIIEGRIQSLLALEVSE